MPQKLIAVGISHHEVPVELREKLVFAPNEIKAILERMKDSISNEALLISTCNRTELYTRPHHDELNTDYLIDFLLEAKKLSSDERSELRKYFLKLSYCDAILHLFEVIAGIDSQIIGDQQIFGQVKDSFRIADEAGASGSFMTKFAHAAFRVAKRVRTETDIVSGAGTISYAAVEFARKVYADLKSRTALVIGAGETAEIAAKHLLEKGIKKIFIANRTKENAESMLSRLGFSLESSNHSVITLSEMTTILAETDIVISSTSNENYVLTARDIAEALKHRKSSAPLVLIDIAVPRDIDPKAAEIPNVFLKDIDDLTMIVNQNIDKRKSEVPLVKAIISEEFTDFLSVFSRMQAAPTIKDLREKFEMVRLEELERNKHRFNEEELHVIDEMTRKMINRLLHTPTVMLKESTSTSDDLQARVELVRSLFALENTDKGGDD